MTSEAATTTKPPCSPELLWKLWHLMLDACIHYLTNTPPEKQRATMLDTARAFLRDNGVQVDGRAPVELKQDAERLHALALPFTQQH